VVGRASSRAGILLKGGKGERETGSGSHRETATSPRRRQEDRPPIKRLASRTLNVKTPHADHRLRFTLHVLRITPQDLFFVIFVAFC
jgi:hypothetical protein